jgi:hypothetical protein
VSIDGTSTVPEITSGSIEVRNSADEVLDQCIDYSLAIHWETHLGTYTFSDLPTAEPYYVTITKNGATITTIVTPVLGKTKEVTMKWCSSTIRSAKLSGAIDGTVVDSTGTPLGGVTVKAYTKDAIYQTTSAATTGAYRMYVPIGTYTLVVEGKDTTTDYANISQTIKVTAGQSAGLLTDSSGQTAWSSMGYESTIGLSNLSISGTSKYVTGTALKGSTVSVFLYADEVTINDETFTPIMYKLLASKKVTGKASDTTGTFSIKLSSYPAGKKIAIRVVDTALNAYEVTTYETSGFDKLTATLTADTRATIVTAVNIVETEPTGIERGNLNKSITSVVVTYGDTTETTLTLTSTQFSLTSKGKLVINKGVLPTARNYTVHIEATNYNDLTVAQTVGASITRPPTSISGTFTLKAGGGSASGSAQFTSIGTAESTNTLAYVVSDKSAIQTMLGNTLTGHTALTANTDITGLSASSTKYIHVYEITPEDAVVKARVFTLSSATIKS